MKINKINQMDCLDLMKMLPDKHFDLIITDPPYGKGCDKGTNGFGEAKNRKYVGGWDNNIPTKEHFKEIIRVSKNQIIFGGQYFTEYLKPTNCWIVWDKKGQIEFENPFADFELAWTSFNGVNKKIVCKQQGFIRENQIAEKIVHPTQKPIKLGQFILQKFAKPHDLIFDPFAGSGSFLVACKQLGFDYVGCEINPEYIKIINERLAFKTVGNFFPTENIIAINQN